MTWRLPQASTMAPAVDSLFNFVLWISIISFLGIVIGKVFFLIRFWRKKRPEHKTAYITGHTAMESSVAFILLVLVMVIFYWGWIDYKKMRTPPSDSMEVNVIAKQWMWEFQYPDGRRLTNELVVPKGKPVKLIMTSQDVLHSFFVPNFRIKQDVVPGTFMTLWFEATQLGDHPIYCAEYCGTGHSMMLGKVRVMEPDAFEEWQVMPIAAAATTAVATQNPAEAGKAIYAAKGCNACHSVDGKAVVGPSFKGIFGHEVELQDGKKATVDESYIRESLMEPQAKIVKGFQPMMPTFKGQLTDDEVNAVIGFIKSLKEAN